MLDSDNCQVFSAPCIRLWYTCGFNTPQICYRESAGNDGFVFTPYPTSGGLPVALLANYFHAWIMKIDATHYRLYGCRASSPRFDMFTSSDGVTNWTLAATDVIPQGVSGWDSGTLGNIAVLLDGGTWRALYEARDPSDNTWKTGAATSVDGIAWTKYGSNPVLSIAGPDLHKIGSTYWVFANESTPRTFANLHTTFSWFSSDMHSWTKNTNRTADLFDPSLNLGTVTNVNGSAGDISILEANGMIYGYYTAYENPALTPYYVKTAVVPGTLANLVAVH